MPTVANILVLDSSNVSKATAAEVKTFLNITNVENTALSTWAGSANITTVGTIATGVWSGTAIAANKGGTGLTSYTTGNYIRAASASTLEQRTPAQVRADIGAGTGNGTVTSVAAGNGMSFTTITGTGTVTMGTPSTLTASTTNSASSGTHTHQVTGFSIPAISSNVASLTSNDTRTVAIATTDLTARGLYQDFKTTANSGAPGNSFSHVQTISLWADDSGGGIHQLIYSDNGNLYRRYGTRAGGWSPTHTLWDSGNFLNIGTTPASARTALGLGTSATVNTGTSGATIPLLSTFNTWSGQQTFPSGVNGTNGDSRLQVFQNSINGDAFMVFHVSGDYAVHFGLDGTANDLYVGGWSMGANKYKIWHSGNHGAASSLDAGLLGGVPADYFVRGTTANRTATFPSDNANTASPSGFYEVTPSNTGGPSANWHWMLNMRHSNVGNHYAGQIANLIGSDQFYVRGINAGTPGVWRELARFGVDVSFDNVTLASTKQLRLQPDAFSAVNIDQPTSVVINLSANYHNNNVIGVGASQGVYFGTDAAYAWYFKNSSGLGSRWGFLNVDGFEDLAGNIRDVPQNIQNANYTFVLADRGKHILKNNTTAYSWTIPLNSSVAFSVGTAITMINDGTAGNITITRTSGVVLMNGTTDANYTLVPGETRTILKVGTDRWKLL